MIYFKTDVETAILLNSLFISANFQHVTDGYYCFISMFSGHREKCLNLEPDNNMRFVGINLHGKGVQIWHMKNSSWSIMSVGPSTVVFVIESLLNRPMDCWREVVSI